ncbi:MAG: RNA polymerase sigma factor [Gammaproteobacteria bacterium]|nr:RNA polymerase sigma factor [Gammaproteobacteria bacterium]
MTTIQNTLNALVRDAQEGSSSALEDVVAGIQDLIHHLAMRILVNPADAQDATQEILILVLTQLPTFRGESAFTTWVYRVATNYLLTSRKGIDRKLSFEVFGADLEAGLVSDLSPDMGDLVMLNELRIFCTMAMLLCLDIHHRIAYVLGDILELEQNEASIILGITSANFRKRLSRARADIVAFTTQACGLVNTGAKCTCSRRLPAATAHGCVTPGKPVYTTPDAPAYDEILAATKAAVGELKVLKLQKATGYYTCPKNLGARIAQIVRANT